MTDPYVPSSQPEPASPPLGGYPPPYPAAPGYPPGLPVAPPIDPSYRQMSSPPGTYVDPASRLILPNGVELASVGRRIGGFFMELLLAIVTLFIGYLIWTLIVWGRGQTPGKQVLGMRCFRPQTGQIAGWGWMALRQLIGGLVEGLFAGLVFLVSAIMMISSNDHKAIHDHIAGTVVLYDPNKVLAAK